MNIDVKTAAKVIAAIKVVVQAILAIIAIFEAD